MKINFQALGCRLNEAELEQWSQQFTSRGHQLTRQVDEADLVIFNSCSVTAEADRKSRKLINRIHRHNPDSKLVVTGCYASLQQDRVKAQLGVDLVVDNRHKDRLPEMVIETFDVQSPTMPAIDRHGLFERGRQRAFIKVQDGCRYRCTFCIVTVARGDERSRQAREIIEEIRLHHQQGIQEIAITGVHVGGYGQDLGSSLYELLAEILDNTEIPRIRLASVEPWDLPEHFFELFSDPRLMPHMHLPLQSGSDRVLRRMARRCKTAEFSALVDKARKTVPHFNVTTDLIVGFPGESEDDWRQTLRYVEQTGFGHMHIFSYSRRSGTRAATLPEQVPEEVKKQRSREMHELAKSLKLNALETQIGRRVEVMAEADGRLETPELNGYTPAYHRIIAPGLLARRSKITPLKVSGVDRDRLCLIGEP